MKKYWYLVFSLSIGVALQAQSFQSTVYGVQLESLDYLNEVCPLSTNQGGMGFQGMDEISQASAERIVDQMLSDMGITNKYKVRECKEIARGNARAQAFFADGRIERYIVYDVDFLREIANSTETNYAAMFVLAHEVGHHINDHTLNYKDSEVPIEIEADVFAGTQLAKSGANLEQTLKAARDSKIIFTGRFATHPGRMDRMKAAFKGWMTYAESDSLILRKNASFIKAYYDEIGEYQKQLDERNNPKSKIADNKTKNTVTNDSNITEVPEPATVETKEEIEQKGAAKVLKEYFSSLGGMAKVNSIEAMSFNELTDADGYERFNYHYDQRSPTLLVITNYTPGYEGEQYKISNDSLYFRYEKSKEWKSGMPSNEGKNVNLFKERIGSSTGNFLEDFKLFSSPSLVALRETVFFEGVDCHRLEVKEILEDVDLDKRGTGTETLVKQNRYYRVSDGLLHATENIRKIKFYKKRKPDGRETNRTVTVHKNYQEVDGLQFPMTYKIVRSIFDGPDEFVDQTITKTVSDIKVTFEQKSL